MPTVTEVEVVLDREVDVVVSLYPEGLVTTPVNLDLDDAESQGGGAL